MKKSFAIALSLVALSLGSTSMAANFTKTSSQPQRQKVTVTQPSSSSITSGSSSSTSAPITVTDSITASQQEGSAGEKSIKQPVKKVTFTAVPSNQDFPDFLSSGDGQANEPRCCHYNNGTIICTEVPTVSVHIEGTTVTVDLSCTGSSILMSCEETAPYGPQLEGNCNH